MEDILIEIKESEKNAEKIAEKAVMEKQEIVQKARQNSVKLINDEEVALDNQFKKEIDKKTVELDKKKNDLVLKSKKELDSLEKKSKAKLSSAVDYIINKFEESLR